MTPDDLDATQDLAAHIHTDYPESHEVFTQRLTVAPEGCHVLASPNGLEGYMISHPWQGTITPALNTLLPPCPHTQTDGTFTTWLSLRLHAGKALRSKP
ncbi:GCN5 family acetyltransferase [Acetobacter orientalis]|uniref:GCN5 family acetyltransferase n=1 Tax=Acetobacter orientalis TaxID=146474 RepID=A0A2Z5ZIJ5_9PROT|nr:GCN5 family acetyltransferase [Acetobacter orientalis]